MPSSIYRSPSLKSRSKLRAAFGLRAALENFLLHGLSMTVVTKSMYIGRIGIFDSFCRLLIGK